MRNHGRLGPTSLVLSRPTSPSPILTPPRPLWLVRMARSSPTTRPNTQSNLAHPSKGTADGVRGIRTTEKTLAWTTHKPTRLHHAWRLQRCESLTKAIYLSTAVRSPGPCKSPTSWSWSLALAWPGRLESRWRPTTSLSSAPNPSRRLLCRRPAVLAFHVPGATLTRYARPSLPCANPPRMGHLYIIPLGAVRRGPKSIRDREPAARRLWPQGLLEPCSSCSLAHHLTEHQRH